MLSRIARLLVVVLGLVLLPATTADAVSNPYPLVLQIRPNVDTATDEYVAVSFSGAWYGNEGTFTLIVDGQAVDTKQTTATWVEFRWRPLTTGTHTLVAQYSGGPNRGPETTDPVVVTAVKGNGGPYFVYTGTTTAPETPFHVLVRLNRDSLNRDVALSIDGVHYKTVIIRFQYRVLKIRM